MKTKVVNHDATDIKVSGIIRREFFSFLFYQVLFSPLIIILSIIFVNVKGRSLVDMISKTDMVCNFSNEENEENNVINADYKDINKEDSYNDPYMDNYTKRNTEYTDYYNNQNKEESDDDSEDDYKII